MTPKLRTTSSTAGTAGTRATVVVLVVLCCLAVVGVVGYLTYQSVDLGAAAPPEGHRSSSQAAPLEAAPSTSPPAEDSADDPDVGPDVGPGQSTWRAAAVVYGEAFTDTAGGRAGWLSRMEDLSSPTLAEGYRSTDLTAVPTATFEGFTGGQVVAGETPSRAVRLHYAGGLAVDATISNDPATGLWVITTAAPAEGPPPGGPASPGESDEPEGRVVA